MFTLRILPDDRVITTRQPQNLLEVLRQAHLISNAPCGGNGTCGKCKVLVDGQEVLACRMTVDRDMTVTLPHQKEMKILLSAGETAIQSREAEKGCALAFDIGTTTVVCALLDSQTGRTLATRGTENPQRAYGADVISRIRAAINAEQETLTALIRSAMEKLATEVCEDASVPPEEIRLVSVVGNPAMQQLFLGIEPSNLAQIPFAPAITKAERIPCAPILPVCPNASLLVIPDISGYVGADTLGCILATGLHQKEEITLLVDIGTNGEMVLGNREGLMACSTAAGPALEGAGIGCGMHAAPGAIDHVWVSGGAIKYSVIGGGKATGICGSGLIDAVAVALSQGLLSRRGRILTEDRTISLGDGIALTQDDIRQLQLAKGAIHAGIRLMARQMGIRVTDIRHVLLAGAFGSFIDPENACRMGLLPKELSGNISAVGNAACTGAKLLACNSGLLKTAQQLTESVRFLELASLPEFAGTFARCMGFEEEAL